MDIVWMGALLALWVVVAAMVVGLDKLEGPGAHKAAATTNGGEAS